MKTAVSIISLFCLVLSVLLCEASEKITVASILEVTGPGAPGAEAVMRGVHFAVRELNQHGGVLGKQVTLVEMDNKSSAIQSAQAAKKALKFGAVAVFGSNWSSNSLAMAPILQAAKIPMISPYSTNPKVTLVGNYIFRVCFVDTFQGRCMASFAFNDLKIEKAAILINANSRYSEGLAEVFKKSFLKNGGKIVIEAAYLQNAEDFSSVLNQIRVEAPDAVFVPGHSIDSARIIRQARDMGMLLPFLGGDGWADAEIMYQHAGSAIHGCFYSNHWHEKNRNKKSKDFVTAFKKRFPKPVSPGSALGYDMVFVFADAVRRANSLEPAKIRDALAQTQDFVGVTGSITFDHNGDPVKPAVILKFDQGTTFFEKMISP